MKQKRKEEREAKRVAQDTPDVVLISLETSKKPKASSSEPANPKSIESAKRKLQVAR